MVADFFAVVSSLNYTPVVIKRPISFRTGSNFYKELALFV